MCGITAIISRDRDRRGEALDKALKTLELRGPDEHDRWEDDGVAIGHRRLAVMGVSNGRQPLVSPDGSIVVACNGELYEHQRLRREQGNDYAFQTGSDSEVLIPLYQRYGMAGMNHD